MSDFAEPGSGMSLPQPALSWVWLVDLERTVALLVGRCLGGMLQGAPASLEEQDTGYWLKTPLFSNGLETDIPHLGKEISIFDYLHLHKPSSLSSYCFSSPSCYIFVCIFVCVCLLT